MYKLTHDSVELCGKPSSNASAGPYFAAAHRMESLIAGARAVATAPGAATERACTPSRLLPGVVLRHVLPHLSMRDVCALMRADRKHKRLCDIPAAWRGACEREFDADMVARVAHEHTAVAAPSATAAAADHKAAALRPAAAQAAACVASY